MHGEYKIPGGKLVVVDLETNEDLIESARISGDFFIEPETVIPILDVALSGQPANASVADLTRALEYALQSAQDQGLIARQVEFMGITLNGIAVAVRRALGHASGWEDHTFELIHSRPMPPVMHAALDQVLAEELAAGLRGPTLRFWEWEEPAVVIGSFQSLKNEIDPIGAQKHGITVVRRVSGGGAMFMEAGNCITFSLVVPSSLVGGLSFEQSYAFLDNWVLGALGELGIRAKYSGLNDIASDAGKIAGAAQKRFVGGAVLHHVTMAYDIDADKMLEVLRIGREKLSDKGTKSANKRVDPLRSQSQLPREVIIESFKQSFASRYRLIPSELSAIEMTKAKNLVAKKFGTDEWLYHVP